MYNYVNSERDRDGESYTRISRVIISTRTIALTFSSLFENFLTYKINNHVIINTINEIIKN